MYQKNTFDINMLIMMVWLAVLVLINIFVWRLFVFF